MNENHDDHGRFATTGDSSTSSKEHADKAVAHDNDAKEHAEKAVAAAKTGHATTAAVHSGHAQESHEKAGEHAQAAHDKAHGAGDQIHAHVAHEHHEEASKLIGKMIAVVDGMMNVGSAAKGNDAAFDDFMPGEE